MKIELKNVQYSAFASQETMCFTATLLLDGVNVGKVRNNGCGGANIIDILIIGGLERVEKADEYCRSLPVYPAMDKDSADLPMDLEFYLTLLAAKQIGEKELKTKMRNNVMFKKTEDGNENMYLVKYPKDADKDEFAKQYQEKYPNIQVLNVMPFDQAFRLYEPCVYEPITG